MQSKTLQKVCHIAVKAFVFQLLIKIIKKFSRASAFSHLQTTGLPRFISMSLKLDGTGWHSLEV